MKEILLVLILFPAFIYGQVSRRIPTGSNYDEKEIRETPKKYGPLESALKTDLVQIAFGDIPIHAEIKLNYNWSINGAVFITYNDLVFNSKSSEDDLKDLKVLPRVGFSLGFRYYFDETFAYKSYYIEGNYRFRNLVREYKIDGVATPEPIQDVVNTFSVLIGQQYCFDNNLLLNMFGGIGYNFGTSTRYIYDDFTSPPTLEDVGADFVPISIRVGLRIGFVFR